jgi:hypothetical protein
MRPKRRLAEKDRVRDGSSAPTASRSYRARPSNGAEASRTALFQPASKDGGKIDAASAHPPLEGEGRIAQQSGVG